VIGAIALVVCGAVCNPPIVFPTPDTRVDPEYEGFTHALLVQGFKDVRLPEAIPPSDGGISSGAVFILGRYLAPPYTVATEGTRVTINGVPCTSLRGLIPEAEKSTAMKRFDAMSLARERLIDAYQGAFWSSGREAGISALTAALEELAGYSVLGVRTEEEKGEEPRRVLVRLTHEDAGEFSVEVEGPSAREWWIGRFGHIELMDEWFKIEAACGDHPQVAESRLIKYARSRPWVTSFEVVDYPTHWEVNGREMGRDMIYFESGLRKETESPVRRDPGDESLLREARRIGRSLRDGSAMFFPAGGAFICDPSRLAGLVAITSSADSALAKRKRLIEVLTDFGMTPAKAVRNAEMLAAFGHQ